MPTPLEILAMTDAELLAHLAAQKADPVAEAKRRAMEAGLQRAADRYGANW